MTEPLIVALIVSTIGPTVLFALGRIFGGASKDKTDNAAKLTTMWEKWSDEQGERIGKLEERVKDLEKSLSDEKAMSADLAEKNRHLSSMLTSLMRWAILLRDEVIRLGGDIPPAPVDIETALTNLEP